MRASRCVICLASREEAEASHIFEQWSTSPREARSMPSRSNPSHNVAGPTLASAKPHF